MTQPFELTLARAQSVGGVMEKLISPGGGIPSFRPELSIEQKEDLGAYVGVDLSRKCEEAH